MYRGDPVEFEFVSADASTAAVITLREAGSRTSRTLAATERFILQSVHGFVTTTTARIIADTDGDGDFDAGDLMVALGTGVNNVSMDGTGAGIAGTKGVIPKVLAAGAGAIQLSGTGVIVKG